MQMASSSAAYLLPGPSSAMGTKAALMKQTLIPPPPNMHTAQHQIPHPMHRSPVSLHSHHQFSRTTPNGDTFHSLAVTNNNNNNGTSLLPTNNHNNSSSILTTNTTDDSGGGGGGGSSGHSLSQSMESINNIGLTDDEVRRKEYKV